MIRTKTIPWTRRLRRNKCQWPNPEASIGTFHRKMGRDSSCWEAVGSARETFIQIADEIKNYLEKASEPVPQAVTWTMYMIGKTKETAEPMILFCCRESSSRKQVRTTIEESGILQRYPGVRIGDASRPPDFDQLVQLAGEISGSSNIGQSANTKKLEFRCRADGSLYANRYHFAHEFDCVMGKRVFVKLPGKDSTIRKATIGGIVQSGSRLYYLTAGHAFESPALETSDDNEVEFDFDIGEESDLELEEDFIDSTSRGSLSPERADYSSSDEYSVSVGTLSDISPSSPGKSTSIKAAPEKSKYKADTADSIYGSTKTKTKSGASGIRDVYVGDLLRPGIINQNGPSIDYALIKITKIQMIQLLHDTPESEQKPMVVMNTVEYVPQNTKILAITGSGRLFEGTISGTPTYNTAGENKVHELWTVKLNGRLEEGDCGSWVVSPGGSKFYGHIVAGSPNSGAAYVVPAYQIFRDAKKSFGVDLRLPTKNGSEMKASTQSSKGVTTTSSSNTSLLKTSPTSTGSKWGPKKLEDDFVSDRVRIENKLLRGKPQEGSRYIVWPEKPSRKEVEAEKSRKALTLSSLTLPSSSSRSPARNARTFPTQESQQPRRSQQPLQSSKPHRQDRKERIVIVDSSPIPRAPPQLFTPPSSTSTTPEWNPILTSSMKEVESRRSRPAIVDERLLHRVRSIEAVRDQPLRARLSSRGRPQWVSPSSSPKTLDERAHRVFEFREERRRSAERERIADLEAERRRATIIRQQNEEIRRRAEAPSQLAQSRRTRIVDQTKDLKGNMVGLSLRDESYRDEVNRARREQIERERAQREQRGREQARRAQTERERARREQMEREQARREALISEEEEAARQILRERQIPKRRFSIGPGNRRHRVLYDDGVYRWE